MKCRHLHASVDPTSNSLLIFFLLFGCFGSNEGGRDLTTAAAVARILEIWSSFSDGVS